MKNMRYTLFLAFLLLAGCATEKKALEAYLRQKTESLGSQPQYVLFVPDRGCPGVMAYTNYFAGEHLKSGQLLLLSYGQNHEKHKEQLGALASSPYVIYEDKIPAGAQPYGKPGYSILLELKKGRIAAGYDLDANTIFQELYHRLDGALKGQPVVQPEGVYRYCQVDEKPQSDYSLEGALKQLTKQRTNAQRDTVILSYQITPEGQVTEPQILKVIGTLTTDRQTLLQLIGQQPAWTPGKVKGKAVTTEIVTPYIVF